MLEEGHSPDVVTFICTLMACGNIGAAAKGKEIHEKVVSLGMLEKDIVVGNALVDMYAKCGELAKDKEVLDEIPNRDVVSWNTLIDGYVQQGQGEGALKCFNDMLHEGQYPDVITFTCALKACGSIGTAAKGEEIHDKLVSLHMLDKDIVIGNALVDMYAKCGALAKAQQLFEELSVRNVVSWNALIAAYVERGQAEEALKCIDDMLHEGHSPDEVTFIHILNACGSITVSAAKGKEIHDKIVRLGMLEQNVVIGNTLMDMYMKFCALAKAEQVLRVLPVQNVVKWSAVIAGYAQQGRLEDALKCFDDMLREGYSPDVFTFRYVLKACGSMGAISKVEDIHKRLVSFGMFEKDTALGITLVDMYMNFGALEKAQQVLKELPAQNVASWSALISGYAQKGQAEEALKCFDDMLSEGHSPIASTFIYALKACGSIGAVAKGGKIHDKIVSLSMLENDNVLGTSVVGMYMKCGALAEAQLVLKALPIQDVATWNALLAGFAQQGQSLEAINCFEKLQLTGVKPDVITLTSVINACSHSGLLNQAEVYFSKMKTRYDIEPNLEHYSCMTDLFGRAGKFNKVLAVTAGMPSDNSLLSWVTILGACRKWGQVSIGRLAFERALHLDKRNVSIYVLMADIYTTAGMQEMQEERDKIEVMTMVNKA